jgi:hypothetical protein
MDPLFVCPRPASLAAMPTQACPEKWDQIQRMYIQRIQATPSFTTTTVLSQATWTPLLAASDNTKIIGTPRFSNLTLPVAEPIFEGGDDNSTINGMPSLSGLPHVRVPLQLRNVSAAIRKALRSYTSESALQPGETGLWAYFVTRYGKLIYRKSGTNVLGIPLYNFVFGDVSSEGFNRDNILPGSFALEPGWSDDVEQIDVPAFSLLTLPNA